jgi:predicted dehydrogenase
MEHNGTEKRLRVGVVGVGYLGKFHAQKYSHMPEVELVGVVDIDAQRAEEVARQMDTQAFTDYRKLLEQVDAVSVVVPTPDHFTVSMDFLNRDVDVLIEKPITTSLAQADELIRVSEDRGLIVQIGHLERYNPAVIALRDYIKQPMFIESHRLSIFKPRCTDVSVVLDLMIHDIDIILNFVKSEVREIRAAGVPVISGQVDIANARLEFDCGCVANVTASRISLKNQRKTRLFQKDAYISVDFASRQITVIHRNAEKRGGLIPGMEVEQLSFTESDVLEDELTAFVSNVISRRAPRVSARVGRDALGVALDIMRQINAASEECLL